MTIAGIGRWAPADVVGDILTIAFAMGVIMSLVGTVFGIARSRTSAVAFGTCIIGYSLTVLTFAKLANNPPEPVTMLDRMWGAITAVIAGSALLGAVITTMRRDVQARRAHQWCMAVALAGILSTIAIYYCLRPYAQLPPSADFLNEYGRHWQIMVYQCLFAAWIAAPVGALGVTAFMDLTGAARWMAGVGGVAGMVWGGWKIVGLVWVAVLGGEHMPMASPVSMMLGVTTQVLCMCGIVLIWIQGLLHTRKRRSRYWHRRARADRAFQAQCTTPRVRARDQRRAL